MGNLILVQSTNSLLDGILYSFLLGGRGVNLIWVMQLLKVRLGLRGAVNKGNKPTGQAVIVCVPG